MVAQRDRGVAVLVVSPELDEVMQLVDRIPVMYRGRIVGSRPRPPCEEIGLLMAGSTVASTPTAPVATPDGGSADA